MKMKKREYSNSVSTLVMSLIEPKGSGCLLFILPSSLLLATSLCSSRSLETNHKKTGPSGPVKNEEERVFKFSKHTSYEPDRPERFIFFNFILLKRLKSHTL